MTNLDGENTLQEFKPAPMVARILDNPKKCRPVNRKSHVKLLMDICIKRLSQDLRFD